MHAQVYELDTYKVTHVARYPAPVLSLGIAPDSSMLAVGMADGMLSVRRNVRGMMRSARDAEAVVNADVFDTVKVRASVTFSVATLNVLRELKLLQELKQILNEVDVKLKQLLKEKADTLLLCIGRFVVSTTSTCSAPPMFPSPAAVPQAIDRRQLPLLCAWPVVQSCSRGSAHCCTAQRAVGSI